MSLRRVNLFLLLIALALCLIMGRMLRERGETRRPHARATPRPTPTASPRTRSPRVVAPAVGSQRVAPPPLPRPTRTVAPFAERGEPDPQTTIGRFWLKARARQSGGVNSEGGVGGGE